MSTSSTDTYQAEIWTEGKTDWRILKKAMGSLEISYCIKFHEVDKDMGSEKLLKTLQTFAEKENSIPMIFVFDRDEPNIMSQVSERNLDYKDWGNNVFSFPIPVPSHRKSYENISIELYFSDDELKRTDSDGRCLFFTSEFNERTGRHNENSSISYAKTGFLKGCTSKSKTKIIDSDVYDSGNRELALSKIKFANYVYQGIDPFNDLDYSEFRSIFNILAKIIRESQPNQSMFFPDQTKVVSVIAPLDIGRRFKYIFQTMSDVIFVALQVFSISVIRVYESQIINEPGDYRKKVLPIKKIINEAFRKPTITTIGELAEKCFYLVGNDSPKELIAMKECLDSPILLEEVGEFLDHLETLFCVDLSKGQIVNKKSLKWNLLKRLIPELSIYMGKPDDVITQAVNSVVDHPEVDIVTWEKALNNIISSLNTIFSYSLIFKKITDLDRLTDEHISEVRTYSKGLISISKERVQRIDDDFNRKSSILVLADNYHIQLFPMLLIRDDTIYSYRRTLPSGFEFYSPVKGKVHIEQTKRKFNHLLFQAASEQEFFWTNVLPKTNPINGIRANIPDEGPLEFIGRRKQINQIKDEIIYIVNENGILYGPGGIGKTALMIQLSKELFEEKELDNIPLTNIIWVSAKNMLYDYIHDSVEQAEPQIKTLENILVAILNFFDMGDLLEYNIEDLKDFTIEILLENKVLLIIDNFETIQKEEAKKILDFFGTYAKKALRKKPEYFKLVITSRELIPSGFRQIELTGLDTRDSKRLMDSLYKRYKSSSKGDLTLEQKEEVYTITRGIPIIIKHCYARIFEYNEPFDTVVRNLSRVTGNIIQFSYKEILQRIEKASDRIALQVLVLMEIVDIPLMIRQIADILEVDTSCVEEKIPLLANFECIKSRNMENQEKYFINDEIRLLTKALALEHRDLVKEIRHKYYKNFTFDKQMDYTTEEAEIISIFEGYIKNEEYTDAGHFIERELDKHPDSILLNYYYAKYLKDRTNDIDRAIKILENLRKISRNHPSVLRLLFNCYTTSSILKYESAENLVNQIKVELGEYLEKEPAMQMEIARFYIRWSIYIKSSRGIDPYEENQRVARYKELAKRAYDILIPIEKSLSNSPGATINDIILHEVCYRLAQCHYNFWEYEQALKYINRAITLANEKFDFPAIQEYERFKTKHIQTTKEHYDRNPFLDRR